ncbi:MAG: class I SAM-dependent methyltransferase [Bdellovibrionales bacterium]|nr:class I SAM-dependent methyltransferase [Bdellovibrionales bacterium]
MSSKNCPCCSAKLTHTKEYRGFSYLLCDSCSFRKVAVEPSTDIYLENAASPIQYYLDRADLDSKDFEERLQWIGAQGKVSNVLDVGANIGTFCDVARKSGLKPVAVELNPLGADLCRKKNHEVWDQEIEKGPKDRLFDFIHLSDVIEHIDSPDAFVSEVVDRLSPGGLLFVSTPDFGNPLVWPIQFIPPEHISLFESKSLRKILEKHGLKVTASRRRSRTRSFTAKGRNADRYPLLKWAYQRLEKTPALSSFSSSMINFLVRENIEMVARKL